MDERFLAEVNGSAVELSDPKPTVRQILVAAECRPEDEHILIRLTSGSANALGLDEPVELPADGPARFRAFRSDRTFRLTIDGRGCEWGFDSIRVTDLRDITGGDVEDVFVHERPNEPDRPLGDGDSVALSEIGTERIRSTRRVPVSLNDTEKFLFDGFYTTEKLLGMLGVENGYLLNVIDAAGKLRLLGEGEKIEVVASMKFISQAPAGGSA